MPGNDRRHIGLERMNRRAISGSVMPAGSSGLRASARSTREQVFRHEVGVPPVALRPATVLVSVPVSVPSSNGTRAMTATFSSRQSGEQLVLGRLVEDVVNHLHRVDQAGAQACEGRSPAPSG